MVVVLVVNVVIVGDVRVGVIAFCLWLLMSMLSSKLFLIILPLL